MAYDIIIIGSGPGGYVAAIRAAQLGFKTAIIEKYSTLGGTCLNVGCIPSKALLDYSEHYHFLAKKSENIGIRFKELSPDFATMVKKKAQVVKQITGGVKFLMDKNKIDVFHGFGTLVSNTQVKVTSAEGKEEMLEGKYIILATGSKPATIPGVTIDKKRVISSTEALSLSELPEKMVIIGAGVIGLELGSVYARLGTQVEVIEYADRVTPSMDGDLSKALQKHLEKDLTMKFYLSHKVTQVKANKKSVSVKATDLKSGQEVSFKADYCLVATGRRPYTDNLGLENVGVNKDERGFVVVNDHLQTSVSNIYAIGDIIRGPMLAHKASEEGIFVVELLAGQKPHINYDAIPSVIYTAPEVACVGKNEEELKAAGIPYNVGKFPYTALGKAIAVGKPEGFVKILSHKETDTLLGMHIFGERAGDMIMEGVLAIEFKASAEDVAMACHPHPTFSEAIKEAALSATGNRALHIINRKR